MDIANLIIRVTNDGLDRATRELRRLQENAAGAQAANERFGNSIADLNKLAMVGFGALTAVVGGSIKTAIDFEKAMAGVAKTVDFAADNGLANMKKGIEDLTKVIPLAFEELAEIASVGGSLGVVEEDILGFTETIAKMGVAFDISAGDAADSMAKIAGVFKIPIAEIGTLGDSINAVSNSVAATAGDVIEVMKRVGGTSGALKISADNTAALSGAMVALGLTPEVAGTAFNTLGTTLANFNDLTKTQASGFKRLGLDTKEFAALIQTDGVGAIKQVLEAAKELGGTDALSALNEAFGAQGIKILQMAEGLDVVDLALEQVAIDANGVSAAFGSMDAEFASVSGTTANKLQLVQNNMRLLAAGVGEAFLPAVNEVILALVPVIEKMTAWAQANPELIVQIAKVTAVVTGAIIAMAAISGAIGVVISTFQGLSAIFGVAKAAILILGGALSLPILIIGALIAIGVALYLNWDTIKEKAAELWQSVVAAWDGLVAGTSAAWDGIKASISGAWDGIVEYTSSAWSSLTSTISAAWESIKSVISAGWEAIVYAFQNPMETIKSILSLLWEAFKTGAVAVFTALVEIFVGGGIELYKSVVKLKDDAIQAFINLKDGAIQALINLKDLAIQAVVAIKDGIILGFNAAIDGALFIWEAFKNGVSVVFNGIKAIIQAGMDAIKWLFDGGWLVILNAVKNTLTTMVSVAKTAVKNLATAIFDGMVTAKNYVVTKVGEILTFFRELPSKMFNLGVDFIKGFANGIKSMASSVWDAAKDVAKGASNIVQKTIDSHSPSKVTHKLGQDFSKGMENGIKKGKKAVVSEAQKMAADAIKATQDAITGIDKELALFGNTSKVAEIEYDIKTGKLGGNTGQLLELAKQLELRKTESSVISDIVSMQREIHNLTTPYTNELSKVKYELESIEGKYKNVSELQKELLLEAANEFDAYRLANTARSAMLDITRQMALLDDNSMFATLSYDLNDVNNQISGLSDTIKGEWLEAVANLERAKESKAINDSLAKSYQALHKEITLFGQDGAMAELNYELQHTTKYAGASEAALIKYADAIKQLAALNAEKAFKGVLDDNAGDKSPIGKIIQEYDDKLAKIKAYEDSHTELLKESTAARLEVEGAYNDARSIMMLSSGEAVFGSLSGLAKNFLGEQSGTYKAMYAMQKAFALSSAIMSSKQAVMDAWANTPGGFWAKAFAAGKVVASTSAITKAIAGLAPQGFKQGGYTGTMGVNDVAGVVHGQEYVFDAQATKRIGVDNLNAMRRGEAPKGGGDVQVNIINNSSARVQASDDGRTITISDVRNEARNEAKRAFSNLQNPNSHESKMVNRNVQAPRRR